MDKLFKKENPPSFEEQRKSVIKKLLKAALKNPITEKEISQYGDYFNKENPTEKEKLFLDKVKEKIHHSTITTDSLLDFKIAMQLVGIPDEGIKDIIEHENAHANKTEELEAVFGGYLLTFYKDDRGEIMIQPSAKYDIPQSDGWDMSRRKEVNREILLAPEKYGNKLSETDLHMLGLLDEKYKE